MVMSREIRQSLGRGHPKPVMTVKTADRAPNSDLGIKDVRIHLQDIGRCLSFTCKYCLESIQLVNVRAHQLEQHGEQLRLENEAPAANASANSQSLPSPQLEPTTTSTSTKERKRFQCQHCPKSFIMESQCKSHENRHTTPPPEPAEVIALESELLDDRTEVHLEVQTVEAPPKKRRKLHTDDGEPKFVSPSPALSGNSEDGIKRTSTPTPTPSPRLNVFREGLEATNPTTRVKKLKKNAQQNHVSKNNSHKEETKLTPGMRQTPPQESDEEGGESPLRKRAAAVNAKSNPRPPVKSPPKDLSQAKISVSNLVQAKGSKVKANGKRTKVAARNKKALNSVTTSVKKPRPGATEVAEALWRMVTARSRARTKEKCESSSTAAKGSQESSHVKSGHASTERSKDQFRSTSSEQESDETDEVAAEECHACKTCRKMIPASLFVEHLYAHCEQLGKANFQCNLCQYTAKKTRELKDHIAMKHYGISRHTCEFCSTKFRWHTTMFQHALKCGPSLSHKCDLCPQRLHNRKQLTKHRLSHLAPEDGGPVICCKVCGESFKMSEFFQHIRDHVQSKFLSKRANGRIYEFECPISTCKYRAHESKFVRDHVASIHHGISLYKCKACGTSYNFKDSLRKHLERSEKCSKKSKPKNRPKRKKRSKKVNISSDDSDSD